MDKPRRYLTPEEELEELEKEAQRGREAFLVNVPLDESLEYSAAFLNGFEEARAEHLQGADGNPDLTS